MLFLPVTRARVALQIVCFMPDLDSNEMRGLLTRRSSRVLCCRCLDEALQDADLRSKLLDSGLLGRALPMLRRCVTGEQGPLAALSSALDSPFPSDNPTRSQTAAATSTAPMLVSLYCRAALHLQLAAANSPSQPAVASSANDPGQGPRAVPRSQNRQANIATGTFGQQQAAVVAGEEARDLEEEARDEEEAGAEEDDGNATVAAAAEVAVQEGCTCVLKLQGRLQAVGVSGVAALMVSRCPSHRSSRKC